MAGLAVKKDFLIVSAIGVAFGLLLIPVLENIQPPQWEISLGRILFLAAGFGIFADFALWIGGLIGSKLPVAWQFTKYAATGSLNALLDAGVLNFLSFTFKIYSGFYLAIFNVIAVSIAITNSYLLNKFWAFKNGKPMMVGEIAKFLAVSAATVLLNTAIVYFITTITAAPANISEPLWENIAKAIAILPTMAANFLGYKFLVFKQ